MDLKYNLNKETEENTKIEGDTITKVGANGWNCKVLIPFTSSMKRFVLRVNRTHSDRSGLIIGIGGENLNDVYGGQLASTVGALQAYPTNGTTYKFIVDQINDTITVYENESFCVKHVKKPSYFESPLHFGIHMFYQNNSVSILECSSILPENSMQAIEEQSYERLNFLLSSFHTVNVHLYENGPRIRVWKSFLGTEEEDLIFDLKGKISNITEENVQKCLLGVKDLDIPIRHYFDYFVLFEKLGLMKQMYIICRLLKRIDSVRNMILLLKKAAQYYCQWDESEDEGEEEWEDIKSHPIPSSLPQSQFKSSFCLAIFNSLKSRERQILENFGLMKLLEKYNLITKLKYHQNTNIFDHPDFQELQLQRHVFVTKGNGFDKQEHDYNINRKTLPQSYHEISKERISEMFYEKKNFNICLISMDGKEIHAHREVLIYRSNFFFNILKYPISSERWELDEKGTVHIDLLNEKELFSYVEYIYTKEVKDNRGLTMKNLIVLMLQTEIYLEYEFKLDLLKYLEEYSKKMFEGNKKIEFLQSLLECGFLVEEFPKQSKDLLLNDWLIHGKSVITKEEVLEWIKKSCKVNESVKMIRTRNMSLKNENSELRKKIDQLETELRKTEGFCKSEEEGVLNSDETEEDGGESTSTSSEKKKVLSDVQKKKE